MLHKDTGELIFFLGAGASIPAGIRGVAEMVNEFLSQLKQESNQENLEVTTDIINVLNKWKNNNQIDIELLLETIEKLENKNHDVMAAFYGHKSDLLIKFEDLEKKSNKNMRLSSILKQSIKKIIGKHDIQINYLNGLLKFMTSNRPLDIFSTNYDACIERFCSSNNKNILMDSKVNESQRDSKLLIRM